ncbi:hypothetical protein FRC18_000140 [Serendipita sp. 400]|nr:hypothetical protein FRC18_000140 [Serendipita sp. 400]
MKTKTSLNGRLIRGQRRRRCLQTALALQEPYSSRSRRRTFFKAGSDRPSVTIVSRNLITVFGRLPALYGPVSDVIARRPVAQRRESIFMSEETNGLRQIETRVDREKAEGP